MQRALISVALTVVFLVHRHRTEEALITVAATILFLLLLIRGWQRGYRGVVVGILVGWIAVNVWVASDYDALVREDRLGFVLGAVGILWIAAIAVTVAPVRPYTQSRVRRWIQGLGRA